MSADYFLDFPKDQGEKFLLPKECAVSITCYESSELRQAVVSSVAKSLYALASSGMDLRALDGVTVALDTRKAACEMQSLPDGAVPLEMSDHPETMELARTVAVRRGRRVPLSHRSASRSWLDDTITTC